MVRCCWTQQIEAETNALTADDVIKLELDVALDAGIVQWGDFTNQYVDAVEALSANCTPTSRLSKNAGWLSIRTGCWMRGRLKIWWHRSVPSSRPIRSWPKRSASRLTTFRNTPNACATPHSERNICSSAQASSKPAARP